MIPYLLNISGGRYAGEPQKDLFNSPSCTPYFDNPKSVSIAWPSESMTTFSGFKSLKLFIILTTYILYSSNEEFQEPIRFQLYKS